MNDITVKCEEYYYMDISGSHTELRVSVLKKELHYFTFDFNDYMNWRDKVNLMMWHFSKRYNKLDVAYIITEIEKQSKTLKAKPIVVAPKPKQEPTPFKSLFKTKPLVYKRPDGSTYEIALEVIGSNPEWTETIRKEY